MITLAEAEQIAAGWAHQESLHRGYPCTPHIDELTLGYAVCMLLPPGTRTEPGADVTTVIDRETGRVSHWPPGPPHELDQRYSLRRHVAIGRHQTADPVAELRREAHRRVSPSVAAHLTLGDRLFRARGAKGDQELLHHPVVAGLLGAIPAAARTRGAERHAELLVLSDVLYEADKARGASLSAAEAADLLGHGRFETFHIRESGDPAGREAAESCATCSDVLTALGVAPLSDRTMGTDPRPPLGADPQPGRFPAEVAAALAAAGWDPAHPEIDPARAIREIEAHAGREHRQEAFPAAHAAYADFCGLIAGRNGPGVAERSRWFRIGRGRLAYLADALHEFGTIVGARMFPLGVEGLDEAVLAVDERGRVFSLDQGGEWFIADTVDEAIAALVTGGPAARRIADDGTW